MKSISLVCLCLLFIQISGFPQPNPQRTPSGDYSVTHLDIRDAVLSLVRVLQDQMDKLERHEVRERQLGEQLTRLLGIIEKRGRNEEKNIENIINYISRIENQIKTIQLNLDKQSDVQKIDNLKIDEEFKILKEFIGENSSTRNIIDGNLDEKLNILTTKINKFDERTEINSNKFDELINTYKSTIQTIQTDENLLQELAEIKESLSRTIEIESQLLIDKQTNSINIEWQSELIESIYSQRKQLAIIEEDIGKTIKYLIDMNKYSNDLQQSIKQIDNDTTNKFGLISIQLDKIQLNTSENIELKMNIIENIIKIGMINLEEKILNNNKSIIEIILKKIHNGNDNLANEMKGLSNVESVLLDTGDSVLDTKRRLEYGVQQILAELNNQIKDYTEKLNSSLQLRFDGLTTFVLGNQSIALTNLTIRMEEEISQVWRQIGILYHQMSRSATLLDEIHSQTSKYVNNSLDTMSSMDGKVGQITNRMGEVDDNLNYLLGRMSLVVQEFNMVKNGLGDALVTLKDSFTEITESDRKNPTEILNNINK